MKSIIVTTKEEFLDLLKESMRDIEEGKATERTQVVIQPDPILTIDEAVSYLKLSKSTLYGYTSKGIMPHFKQGKRVLFRKSQLDQWLNEKQRGNTSEL